MPAPAEIRKLVERFEANLDTYRGGSYNETLLRRDLLDPFFRALGWDVDNSLDYAEAFREVIHEDAIKAGGSTKAPDYRFRIGGRRIFFLEAKKPSVFIKEEIARRQAGQGPHPLPDLPRLPRWLGRGRRRILEGGGTQGQLRPLCARIACRVSG